MKPTTRNPQLVTFFLMLVICCLSLSKAEAQQNRYKTELIEFKLTSDPATVKTKGVVWYDNTDSLMKVRNPNGTITVLSGGTISIDTVTVSGDTLCINEHCVIIPKDSLAISNDTLSIIGSNYVVLPPGVWQELSDSVIFFPYGGDSIKVGVIPGATIAINGKKITLQTDSVFLIQNQNDDVKFEIKVSELGVIFEIGDPGLDLFIFSTDIIPINDAVNDLGSLSSGFDTVFCTTTWIQKDSIAAPSGGAVMDTSARHAINTIISRLIESGILKEE